VNRLLLGSQVASVIFASLMGVVVIAVGQESSPNDQRSAGRMLAETQLRELIPVLDHLKKASSPQFEKAIGDLDRTAKRLDAIKNRDSKLYELSLREWKLRCRIDLLKARARVRDSEKVQMQLSARMAQLPGIQSARIERELTLLDDRERTLRERAHNTEVTLKRVQTQRLALSRQQERIRERQATRSTKPSDDSRAKPSPNNPSAASGDQ